MRGIWTVMACGALAVAGACGGSPPTTAKAPAPAAVANPTTEAALATITLTTEAETRLGIETSEVRVENVARARTFGGDVVVPADGVVVVSAPVAGTLVAAPDGLPSIGSVVARGRALFQLVPLAPAERDVRIDAERDVADAAARLEAASTRAARAEQLLKARAGSVRNLEEARAELAGAEAAHAAATARLTAVKQSPLDSRGVLTIDAPAAGELRAVHAAPGQVVAAGASLVEIARVSPLWVRVPVYVGDADLIDREQPAVVVGLDDPLAEGRTVRPVTAPRTADPAAASMDLVFELPNADRAFRPGQRVGVRLRERGTDARLVVRAAALVRDIHGGTWVYENTAPHVYVRRRVEVEREVDALAVLARGLAAGARIVTTGAAELFGTEFGVGK